MNKFVFFGTSEFAVNVLIGIQKHGLKPSLIITETDKAKGRGQKISEPHAKTWAKENGIPTYQPLTLKNDSVAKTLSKEDPAVFLIAEYGKFLPKGILDIPKHGALNIHPSLLPKYRGPSPVETAILDDSRNIGVSLMLLDELMDHGPIIAQKSVVFEEWPPRAKEARRILAAAGADLFFSSLHGWINGTIKAKEQNDSDASYSKKLTKRDGQIDLSADAYLNWRTFCAYDGSIGTYFELGHDGKKDSIKINDAKFEDGNFIVLRVTPPNKREMNYADFLRGIHG